MNKLIKVLNQTNYEDVSSVNKLLRGIKSDIIYFNRTGKKYMVREIGNLLTNYLSTNHFQINQNQENSYLVQRFFQESGQLIRLCNELG